MRSDLTIFVPWLDLWVKVDVLGEREDARRALLSSPALVRVLLAEDLMHHDVPVVTPDESLGTTLAKFTASRLQELPVVRASGDRRLVGALAYADVLAAYQAEVLKADSEP